MAEASAPELFSTARRKFWEIHVAADKPPAALSGSLLLAALRGFRCWYLVPFDFCLQLTITSRGDLNEMFSGGLRTLVGFQLEVAGDNDMIVLS